MSIACRSCGEKISGRSDKKFCDDYCRSSFHQKSKAKDSIIKNMNSRLNRNRNIIKKLIDEGKKKCTTQQLIFLGFDFSIHTSIYMNEIGETCYYCYDRGYISKGNNKYHLLQIEF